MSAEENDSQKNGKMSKFIPYLRSWSTQFVRMHPVVAAYEAVVRKIE
jgi:hypothetical protein